ncbi:hypothetical protein V7S43_009420 [Phytophthora oleae]|uniref:Intimal thickness related receptor IRP domain-containing protein n=1 Tax=Phytophthora oleae TaxID=2107226 RepID=A0ABD3FF60_9STRA
MTAFIFLLVTIPTLQVMMSMPYTAVPSPSSSPSYYYHVTVESYTSQLQYLGEYNLGNDGSFDIELDILLPVPIPKVDKDRNLLYLLACEQDAADAFLRLPRSNDDHTPPYCAMVNRTLDYYCQSFPLEDESPDEFVYQVSKIVTGSVASIPPSTYSLTSDTERESKSTVFFIDACETLGGQKAILRSCLQHPPDSSTQSSCFYCPTNYPLSYTSHISAIAKDEECETPPPLQPTIRGTVSMNLCHSSGNCLGKTTSFQFEFYGLSSLVWGVTSFVWIVHIRAAAHDVVIELQTKMKLVPVTQTLYSILTLGDLYAEEELVGTARSLARNVAVLAQFVALAVFAEVVVVIAKGWKITRPALLPREVQWIRFVTLSWAGSFAVLKHSGNKQLAVVVVWGLSWACVVFMVWYNSAFHLNMLKYQLAMVRQLDLDPQRTPVYTKFMLFRRFRGLLAGYIFLSCLLGIVGLVDDATQHSSEWTSLVADEGLTLLLFVALGYTFRCRRFGRLQPRNTVEATTVRSDQGAPHRGSILPEPTPMDTVEPPKRKKTIVVLNPDQAPWLATLDSSEQPKNTVSPQSQ